MSKKFKILSLIMALALVCGLIAGCGSSEKEEEVNVKADDPAWHGNGMQPAYVVDEDGNMLEEEVEATDSRQKYSLECRFEGKMDENSFEVTELGRDTETDEFVEGPLLQLRVGNTSVREDINVAEIGERLLITCCYNEDSQLVAERIILLGT